MTKPSSRSEPSLPTPRDRQQVDGAAGRGDALGGLTTGAGGRLGVPDSPPTATAAVSALTDEGSGTGSYAASEAPPEERPDEA